MRWDFVLLRLAQAILSCMPQAPPPSGGARGDAQATLTADADGDVADVAPMTDASPAGSASSAPAGSVPRTKRARGTPPVTPPRASASTTDAGVDVAKRSRGGSGAGADASSADDSSASGAGADASSADDSSASAAAAAAKRGAASAKPASASPAPAAVAVGAAVGAASGVASSDPVHPDAWKNCALPPATPDHDRVEGKAAWDHPPPVKPPPPRKTKASVVAEADHRDCAHVAHLRGLLRDQRRREGLAHELVRWTFGCPGVNEHAVLAEFAGPPAVVHGMRGALQRGPWSLRQAWHVFQSLGALGSNIRAKLDHALNSDAQRGAHVEAARAAHAARAGNARRVARDRAAAYDIVQNQ